MGRWTWLCGLLLGFALAGCGDDGGSATPPGDGGADASATSGQDTGDPPAEAAWSVAVDEMSGAWTVAPPGAIGGPVLAGSGWLELAVGGAPEVEMAFGAFRIDLDGAAWAAPDPAAAPVIETGDGWTEVRRPLLGAEGSVGLRFEEWGDGHLRIALVTDAAVDVSGGAIAWDDAPDTGWFGLGSQTVGLDLNGRRYPLLTQEQGIGKPEGGGFFPVQNVPEAAYAPMGLWHTTAGWSAVLDVDAYTELDLTANAQASLRTWGELPAFVVLAGETAASRVEQLTAIVGRIEPPAPWVFGPWNDAVGGPERLHEVAELLRAQGIPSSAIWSEDWIGGSEGPGGFILSYAWAWDPTLYPDLPEDVAGLHDHGFAFLGYFNTFVPMPTAMWDEGVAGGFLIGDPWTDGPYVFVDPGGRDTSLVDLTNPDAVAWLKGYLTTAADDLAIDGWMADFTEWLPLDAVLHSGESPWLLHNRYPVLWQRINREVMTEVHGGGPATAEGWTFFARSGWASTRGASAAETATMWGGDQNTTWDRGDGLPTVIPAMVHLGLSGVPIFGTDIAGYSAFTVPPTDKELFYRWTGLAAFHPLMRTHHGSSECANWAFDRDAETLEHYRRWARVHTLLYPVWTALADEAVATGLPIARHPWLVEPDEPALWGPEADVFFVGDDLLVAPVVTEGATSREVLLPGAGWWPLLGAAPLASGGAQTVDAATTEVPAFVRPGAVLPLLAEPVDSHYGATEAGVSDLDDVAGDYRLALYPTADGSLTTTDVAGTAISGAVPLDADWSAATVDGAPVSACGDSGAEVTCLLAPDTLVVVAASATVEVGGQTLEIAGAEARTWRLAIAGAAWGELTEPTPLTELSPDIPPPCEE